jgi:CHAD domain-containing protein
VKEGFGPRTWCSGTAACVSNRNSPQTAVRDSYKCVTISTLESSPKIQGIATRRYAREQAEKLLGSLAFRVGRVNKSHNAETVHDLRVSVRRFSQLLRVFRPSFRGKELRKIRRELKQIMAVAGEVRNHDIALRLLAKSKRTESTSLQNRIQIRRRELERSLLALLKTWLERKSSLKWRATLARAVAEGQADFSKAPVAQIARQMLPGMAEDFFERGDSAAGDKTSARELHRFRIASKKFRYSLELFAPLCGSSLPPKLEAIRRVQTLLGDVNDLETLRELIRPFDGTKAVVAWLRKRQRRRLVQFREHWANTFAPAAERERWLDFLKQLAPQAASAKKPARSASEARPARGAAAVA